MKTVVILALLFNFTLFTMQNELYQEQTYIDKKGNAYPMLILGPDLDERVEWKQIKEPLRRCIRNGFGQRLLFEGCLLGKLCLVKRAIKNENASINVKDKFHLNKTPLHVAIDGGYKAIVDYLLNLDPAIDARDVEGYTTLHAAVYQKDALITEKLCDAGADVNTRNNDSKTILMEAVETKYIPCIEILLAHQPEINAQNNDGETALHIALQHYQANDKSKPIIKALLAQGADLYNIKNKKGKTAFDSATKQAKLFLKLYERNQSN